MRIQHNIMAMNAYRNYNTNTSALSKNLEKLSSGYKINRAGDDAAGLAISEKMRAQITGLNAAQKNVKDGISLVKTAEGAMQEIQDMLNRMSYLATQSANGTYDDDVDRKNLQKEVDQLLSEIDRIADSANFNGIKLLDGSMAAADSSSGTELEFTGATNLGIIATAGSTQGTNTIVHESGKDAKATTFDAELSNVNFSKTSAGTGDITVTLTVGGATVAATFAATSTKLEGKDIAEAFDSKTVSIGGVTYNIAASGDKLTFTMADDAVTASTQAGSFTGSFAVEVGAAQTDGTFDTEGSDTSFQTSNIDRGNAKVNDVLADTLLTTALAATDFKDGAGLKIGDETYVFALTQGTKDAWANESGVKVVDLIDLAADDPTTGIDATKNSNTALNEAVERLTKAAAGNEMFVVGNGDANKLSFREQTGYEGDADLTTVANIQAQIQKFTSVKKSEPDPNAVTSKPRKLQIGDTADSYNQLEIAIGDMHRGALGLTGLNISDPDAASKSIQKIKDAINQVSSVRGDLGAYQNRLEHTANNLSVMAENIQDAESTIRDTDVAEEMMAYTKNNILIQSAQAMLAQANAVPQGVLQLLQ